MPDAPTEPTPPTLCLLSEVGETVDHRENDVYSPFLAEDFHYALAEDFHYAQVPYVRWTL